MATPVVIALVLILLPRFVAEAGEDVRAKALSGIITGGLAYSPLGSGLGTFEDIYRTQERPETVTNAFLNHAHNDYLELWLETGLVGQPRFLERGVVVGQVRKGVLGHACLTSRRAARVRRRTCGRRHRPSGR